MLTEQRTRYTTALNPYLLRNNNIHSYQTILIVGLGPCVARADYVNAKSLILS